jgi:hypothetical protein
MANITLVTKLAPKCSLPGCNNQVSYHKQYPKLDGTVGFKWKTMCEEHRGSKKYEVDNFKLSNGCANRNGSEYEFPCGSTITYAGQIDINHKDGNRQNTDPANVECLCRNCHSRVTHEKKHHLNRYNTEIPLPDGFDYA